jgi:O-antigen/teichoic acid export membrane protein
MSPFGSIGNDGQRVVRNVVIKALTVPIEKASRLLIMILAAPVLGAAKFGIYQFVVGVTSILVLGGELGLGVWTTRALARNQQAASKIVSTAIKVRAATGVLYLLAIVIVALASGSGEERAVTLLLGVGAFVNSFSDYLGAVFRGFEQLRSEARVNIGRAVLIAGCGLGALMYGRSLTALAAGLLLGTALSAIWGYRVLGRECASVFPWQGHFDRAFARSALSESTPIWLGTLVALIYFKADIVILRTLAGAEELGSYSAAYRVFESVMLLPSVVMGAAFAPLARAHGKPDEQRRWERSIVIALFAMGAVVGALVYLGSGRIVGRIFGADFSHAQTTLQILSLGIPILFVNSGLRQFLIARGLERANLYLSCILLVFNVGLNLAIIPRFQGAGAAATTVATELVLAVSAIVAMRSAGRTRNRPVTRAG